MTSTTTVSGILARIRSTRITKGITRAEMAEKMCIRTLAYERLERGVTKLDVQRLIEIIRILEIEI